MATKTSATDSKPTQVPFLNLTQDPTASNVNTIANERISPPLSPTSASLKSKEPVNDQLLLQKYIQACELTDPVQAKVLFLELVRDMPKTEAHLLFLTDCKLKLAYTYPEETERTQAALDAKADLDRVYENRSAWNSLNKEEKINRYKHLRICLKTFENLVQNDMSSLENSVELQIKECNLHIPLITDFYDKLIEGDRLQEDQAREVYIQALKMIEGYEQPDYLLARASGTTCLALTYKPDDDNPYSQPALDQTVLAYQHKDALCTSDQATFAILKTFQKLFHNLIQLFSDSDVLVAINKMEEECSQKLAHCQDSVPKDENGTKVTKEPVDHWKTARLVFAFGFAAFFIAGAFVLGRRYITRLN